jgi:hypothetical protein
MMCPSCHALLDWATVRIGQAFDCPKCGAALEARASYGPFIGLLSLAASVAVAYAVGARAGVLWIASAGLWIPALACVSIVVRVLFPPVVVEVQRPLNGWTPLGSPSHGDASEDPAIGPIDADTSPLPIDPDDSPSVTRWLIVMAAACLTGVSMLVPFIDESAAPFAKWAQLVGGSVLAWAVARVLPVVWEDRRDDKVAVLFVGALLVIILFNMWNVLTTWP